MPAAASPDEARARFRAAVRSHVALWAVLVALVALSLGLAFLPLGPLNLVVAVAIAVAQVALLGVFFMELRQAPTLILVTAGAGFVFLLAMVVLTFNDVFSRIE